MRRSMGFQLDNAAIYSSSRPKKYLLKKEDFLTMQHALQKIRGEWLLEKFMKDVDSTP